MLNKIREKVKFKNDSEKEFMLNDIKKNINTIQNLLDKYKDDLNNLNLSDIENKSASLNETSYIKKLVEELAKDVEKIDKKIIFVSKNLDRKRKIKG